MPRGLGHWFPEHQGNAKTPADRGRFPPKSILRNDSLVLRFSYCDAQAIGLITKVRAGGNMKANRRTTALKSKAESKVAGRSKVARIAKRHEELHREQLRPGAKARRQRDLQSLVPPRPPAGTTQAPRCRRARSASPARKARFRRRRHFLRRTTRAAASSPARSPLSPAAIRASAAPWRSCSPEKVLTWRSPI